MYDNKFQELMLEHMAKITQQLTTLDQRMTKLEVKVENEVTDKLKLIYEKVDSIDQRLSSQEDNVGELKIINRRGN